MHLEADRDIDAKHQWNHWPPLFNPSTIGVRSEEVKQQVIKRRSVIAGVGGLLGTPAIVRAQGQNGVALVIGNSKYKWEASLPNVKRDGPDVARRFEQLGLKTVFIQDVGLDAMKQAFDRFFGVARSADLAALYFAGHGVRWGNLNYIVPEDADLSTPSAVESLVSVASLTAGLKDVRRYLLVFDSCRNNPADGWRQREAFQAAANNRGRSEEHTSELQSH